MMETTLTRKSLTVDATVNTAPILACDASISGFPCKEVLKPQRNTVR